MISISKTVVILLSVFIVWLIGLVGYVVWHFTNNSNSKNAIEVVKDAADPKDAADAKDASDAKEPTFILEEEVANHNKEQVIIEGVIKYNFNSGKQTILSFHDHHKGYFKVLIRQKDYPAFQKLPDEFYKKEQKIRVTGLLDWYQGDRTIFVTTPAQIELL